MERLESAISPLKKLLVGLLVSTRRKIRVHKYKLMKIPLVSLLFNDSLLSESQFCSGCCPVLVHSARIKNVNDLILIQILKGIYYSTQIHSTKEQMHCSDEKIRSNLCQQIQAQFNSNVELFINEEEEDGNAIKSFDMSHVLMRLQCHHIFTCAFFCFNIHVRPISCTRRGKELGP